MKRKQIVILMLWIGLGSIPALAQTRFPVNTEQFARKASEVTKVSLDKNMLQFAAKFMSSSTQDQQAQSIINHLDGIYVRDYTYKGPGGYSLAAVEALRKRFRAPEWTEIVSTHSKGQGDNTDIYVRTVGGQIHGMFVISAEPNELTFVDILGPIKPEDLKVLSGHFGMPAVHAGTPGSKAGGKPGGKKKGSGR